VIRRDLFTMIAVAATAAAAGIVAASRLGSRHADSGRRLPPVNHVDGPRPSRLSIA